MPTVNKFFKQLGQRGVIHLIPLFLLLAGIIAGVYLVQQTQIFKPKAAANNVEILKSDGQDTNGNPCNVYKDPSDGKLKTTCGQVKLKFTSPLETQGSSDAGFQLIKTVYAASPNRTGDECGDDPTKIYESTPFIGKHDTAYCSEGLRCRQSPLADFTGTFPLFYKNVSYCVNSSNIPIIDDERWGCTDDGKLKKTGFVFIGDITLACPGNTTCKKLDNNRVTCVPPVQQAPVPSQNRTKIKHISPSENQVIELREKSGGIKFEWEGVEKAQKYIFRIGISGYRGRDSLIRSNDCPRGFLNLAHIICKDKIEGTTYTVSADIFDKGEQGYYWHVSAYRDKDLPEDSIGRSEIAEFTVRNLIQQPLPPPVPPPAGAAPKTPEIAPEIAPVETTVETKCIDNPVTPPANYKWKADCSKTCQTNANCPPSDDQFVCPSSSNWCYDFAGNIGKRCLMLEYIGSRTGEIPPGPGGGACPERPAGGPGVGPTAPQPSTELQKRMTKFYRFAEDYILVNTAEWKEYSPDSVTITYTFKDQSSGHKFIYAQFQDDQGNIINASPYPAQIELVAPTPAAGGPAIPAPGCPLDNFRNFDIPTLKQKCSLLELTKLPLDTLNNFSNQDLLEIAKNVDGTSGPYEFLSLFDNKRLVSFDLSVLKKLPEGRISALPEGLRKAIKGEEQVVESASCISLQTTKAPSVFDWMAGIGFSGNPDAVKIWVASNSDKDKSAENVASWTLVETISNPYYLKSGSAHVFTTRGFEKGRHAVLMSLHGSFDQMLDGNPEGKVNSRCASSVTIQ